MSPSDLEYSPLPEQFNFVVGQAQGLAAASPEVFALVWFNGKDPVIDIAQGDAPGVSPIPEGVQAREVEHSLTELMHAQEELNGILLSTVGRDAGAWMTFLDPRSNSAVLAVTSPNVDLIDQVRAVGAAASVVVLESPNIRTLSRTNDTSPFTAGARISGSTECTSGFSWTSQGSPAMLTAGHCTPSGGTVTVPGGSYGTVTSGSGENWTTGVGTVFFPGDTVYRGDLAMVKMTSPGTTQGRIYVAGPTSGTRKAVGAIWTRSPLVADAYCTGGAFSGEQCGWTVAAINADVLVGVELVRNVSVSSAKTGTCLQPGDSGGPVYTNRVDGKVTAKGIISAGSGGGGDYVADENDPCYSVVSDVRQALPVFGGSVQTA